MLRLRGDYFRFAKDKGISSDEKLSLFLGCELRELQ
jgi:hypothetical protein